MTIHLPASTALTSETTADSESTLESFVLPRKHRRLATNRLRIFRRVLLPLFIIGLWCAVTYTDIISAIYLPSPSDLWTSLEAMWPRLPSAILSSVTMTLVGFFLGTTLGIGVGLLMAYSRLVRDFFGDVLDFTRPIPVFALIPLFVLWFGIGKTPQIALIALGCATILGVATVEAIRNVSPVHIKAALTLGAGRGRIYRTVVLPSIFPHLLGAIRVAAAASWGLDVAAEFIGAQNGLGYLMIVQQQYLDTAGIFVLVIIYAILALGLDAFLRYVERPLTRWTERGARQGVVASIVGRA